MPDPGRRPSTGSWSRRRWGQRAADAAAAAAGIAEALGAGLLIAITYGALGTLCRRRVAATLAWYFLINIDLFDLSIDAEPVAELLVMGRWPAMRALVLIMPALTLFDGYLEPYALYRAGTTSVSGTSPSQVLLAILPGQCLPAVLNSIGFDYTLPGTATFFLIGALAGGSTWGGRTIKTSLLQAPARTGTALG